MKKFLAIYLISEEAIEEWKTFDEDKKKVLDKAGMEEWTKWMEENKKAIVDNGAPIGKTKRIEVGGISDTKNNIGGYTIVEAASHEAAAELFLNHPHFMMFPGDSVEVMECLDMPKM